MRYTLFCCFDEKQQFIVGSRKDLQYNKLTIDMKKDCVFIMTMKQS